MLPLVAVEVLGKDDVECEAGTLQQRGIIGGDDGGD